MEYYFICKLFANEFSVIIAYFCKNEKIEIMEDLLKEKGFSVTKQRLALLGALKKLNKPVTIEELGKQIEISMDTSTIYRSLKILVDHGLVYQTDFREGVSYFEFHGDDHHHHLICTSCKDRQKIDLCLSKKFPAIEKQEEFTITNHIFEIFGLCKNCS